MTGPAGPSFPLRILFVVSTGGHLTQLVAMRDWWEQHDRAWVTFDNAHARNVLANERMTWAHSPTTRNIPNAVRNLGLAWRMLRRDRPDIIVSTGAGVAVPFFLVAKVLGIKTVFIEVIDRISSRTLTARILYPLVDGFAVQWEEQRLLYPGATLVGPTL